ncbi:MAG: type VI secretion system baseplate subunit TssE [Thermodesulfobacteriota bacterium]
MREERLLERLSSVEREPDRRETGDVNRQIFSILRHLERILNTRQGNVPIAPDFGMPDFTNIKMFGSESARDIEKTIQQIIERYEPRLVRTRCVFAPQEEDVLALRFKISARLAQDKTIPVEFNTIVKDDGKISITD